MSTTASRASRWLNAVPLTTSSTLFFLGTAEGELRAELAERAWSGRVVALAPPAFAGLEQVAGSLEPDAEHPLVVLQPEVIRDHRDAVKDAARRIGKAWFGARANQQARRENAGRYLLNTLRNRESIAAEGDAAVLVGAFPSAPAIVVAAGPSLDANLPEIARNRDKALVIAVDTALRPLLAAGIQPDFVVAVDPSEPNANHLVDLPVCESTYLVAEGSLDPEALTHFRGRTFFFNVADHHPWPWLRAKGVGRGRLRAWGSVLTTAFDLALKMGCSPVMFAGADLAFTGGRPYASGTSYDEVWQRDQAWGRELADVLADRITHWPLATERGIDGVDVRTAPHLRAFRDWIQSEARLSGRSVINTTPCGILHGDGITQAAMDAALASAAAHDWHAAIQPLYRASVGQQSSLALDSVDGETTRDWSAFAGLPVARIAEALSPTVKTGSPSTNAVAAEHPRALDDAEFVASLSGSCETTLLTAREGGNFEAELMERARSLRSGQAIVITDDCHASQGTRVRRAVDALLCKRNDLALEYRRFANPASRVSVVSPIAAGREPGRACDAVKWDPTHEQIARKLVPIIAAALRPASAIDIGCGAGFWLTALSAAGVADVRGITSQMRETGAAAGVVAGSLIDQSLIDRRYEAALCLEVIQRVPLRDQDALIAQCVKASDTVVFSSQVPGVPGSEPFERPLQYWAAKFWEHGYVVDDALRPMFEERGDHAGTVYEMAVVFRRLLTPEQVADASLRRWGIAQAARLHELYLQKVWWATTAAKAPTETSAPPVTPLVSWIIPPSRMASAADGRRVFKFRTAAARWFVTHPGTQTPLRQNGELISTWSRWRDEITFTSTDGSDPRVNRQAYAIDLPSHVAWAESQAWADIGQHGL